MCWRKSNTKSAFTEELNSKNSEISTLTIKVEELKKNSANNLLEIDR